MKLTKNQKHFLKTIKDKKIRKEVKKEFKKKITFYHTRWKFLDEVEPIVFENGKLETDNPKIQEFLSQHPMCEKNKLTDEFISPEKAIEILSEKKPKEFCVEITEENRKILDIASIKRNSAGNRLIVGQFLVCNNEEFLLSDFRCCKLVTTQEFLKLIGREDLIKSKTVKLSELTFKTFNFSSANLSDLQIEKVIEWMNTWEQLKDTAIPIRFKEDFTIKK